MDGSGENRKMVPLRFILDVHFRSGKLAGDYRRIGVGGRLPSRGGHSENNLTPRRWKQRSFRRVSVEDGTFRETDVQWRAFHVTCSSGIKTDVLKFPVGRRHLRRDCLESRFIRTYKNWKNIRRSLVSKKVMKIRRHTANAGSSNFVSFHTANFPALRESWKIFRVFYFMTFKLKFFSEASFFRRELAGKVRCYLSSKGGWSPASATTIKKKRKKKDIWY